MRGGEIEWAELANQFLKDASYQEILLMEHEVLNTTRGFRGNPNLTIIPPTADFRPNSPPEGAVCVYRAHVEYGLMLPPQSEFKEILNSFQLVPAQLSPNTIAYVYSFQKLLQAQRIPWTLTLFRSLFSWMVVPGYMEGVWPCGRRRGRRCSQERVVLTPTGGTTKLMGDAKWMAGSATLKILEKLKGQSWPLKDFLRHVRNDVSLHAKALGYAILKEVTPPPGTVQMKRVRRGQPPATQLSREITEVGEEEEIGVPEPVCGGTAIDVVSSPEDTPYDRKTLAELGYTGKGKGPMPAAKPQPIPKGAQGIVIRGQEEGNKADGGREKEEMEGPCMKLVLTEATGEKRGSSGSPGP
ncbi:hypothetical protein AXF42_Ash019596 [Apostasia shenzhenica]|uniref:Transposase (putative) gypsy type domain-containing protein n=1 Tax=Apostasia shenzhenica TaxID=1088818 RepID=A0A2I0A3G5_9ASPA|nr:hypothetical protein AXF42_Ash019596 [Apostasia shenzhenica]